jgi:serine phosphatase RsbU (regulator of sigma subunit)
MKILKLIFVVILISVKGLISQTYANDKNLDSILYEINSTLDGEQKIDAVNSLIKSQLIHNTRNFLELTNLNLKNAFESAYNKGIADAYYNLGKVYFYINYLIESDSVYNLSKKYYLKTNNKDGLINLLIDKSLTQKSLKIFDESLETLNEALQIAKQNKPSITPIILQEIGNVYTANQDFQNALEYLNQANEIFSNEDNKFLLAILKVDIGLAHLISPNPLNSIPYFSEARNYFGKNNKNEFTARTYKYEGDAHKLTGNLEDAFQNYLKALDIYTKANDFEGKKEIYYELYLLETMRNNIDKAFNYLELYTDFLRDELDVNLLRKETEKKLNSETIQRQIAQNKITEAEKEINYIKSENEIRRLENENQSSLITFFIILSILFVIILVILYLLFKNNKKNNAALTEINNQLISKNQLIDAQNKQLGEKNKNILDSINYARRIQKAVLPIESMGREIFDDFFVLFKPKDIVSGDFFWLYENEQYKFAVIGDCTGHGVPGAFMALIGNTLLNEIIKSRNIIKPNEILTNMDYKVRESLKQDKDFGANDGMDMAILRIDKFNFEITFAGAKRPLYYVEDNNFFEIKGDKLSVGGYQLSNKSNFTLHTINYNKSICLYLTSDGYADQNNPNNKKLGTKYLKNIILQIANSKFDKQYNVLEKEFNNFKLNEAQRDDVVVMGIKVSK